MLIPCYGDEYAGTKWFERARYGESGYPNTGRKSLLSRCLNSCNYGSVGVIGFVHRYQARGHKNCALMSGRYLRE